MVIIGRDIIYKMYCTLLTFRSLDVHFMSMLVHGHKLSFLVIELFCKNLHGVKKLELYCL